MEMIDLYLAIVKIRIKDNSLRLRLTQSEVDNFKSNKRVESVIAFPNNARLIYSLHWGLAEDYSVGFDANTINIVVPNAAGEKWLEPTEVGMETNLNLPKDQSLRVLIEKDFACLTERVEEDESDNFPNPLSHC
ncbi:MAG TPA: hypothetical protein DCX14_05065 [Flavobacteriales bacterium]|nr:hypothetical protein [Flavobacteriales bacterium]